MESGESLPGSETSGIFLAKYNDYDIFNDTKNLNCVTNRKFLLLGSRESQGKVKEKSRESQGTQGAVVMHPILLSYVFILKLGIFL